MKPYGRKAAFALGPARGKSYLGDMNAKKAPAEELVGLTFEDAMGELEKIVRELEGGNVKLEDAITKYERGKLLQDFCQKKLQDAQLKVEKMTVADDGTVTTAR